MITSMTGFGRRQGTWQDQQVTVEIRSVNHRFLESSVRVPKTMGPLEDTFKKAIQSRCRRGRVDLSVMIQSGRNGARTLQVDTELATQYHRALRTLQKSLKLKGTIDVAWLAGLRDVITLSDQPAEDPEIAKLITKLVTQAIQDLAKMRAKEGALLAADIRARIEVLRGFKGQVAAKAPHVAQEAFDRMRSRVEKLLAGPVPDQAKLYQELAVFSDRSDITEELVRLDAHMVQFEHTLQSEESVGKTLDFLVQEMGREINTIGSKANDLTITSAVVQMKAELERIREQIQNVE